MFILTADIVTKVSLTITGQRASEIARLHTEICPLYGIDSANIFHEFFANVLHESECFTRLEEGLNYKVQGLIDTFGLDRISVEEASRFGRKAGQIANKVAIANTVYGGSWGKQHLGNIHPNDGWEFRGAGPIQMTGRGNITAFTDYFNGKFKTTYTPELMASRMRADLATGIHSACWIFAISKKLIDEAERDEMRTIIKKINGGYLGEEKRMAFYERAKKYITD